MIRTFVGVLVAVLAVACGGGGGGTQAQLGITGTAPAGTVDVVYPAFSFGASGGGVAPFTWTESGTMPPGLALGGTGELVGTPVTAGTYPVSVTVSDSSTPALTATVPINLVINDTPIVIAASPTPQTGIASYPYAFAYSASGGSPPYTWATGGTLPPGLTLSPGGSLSGTPSKAGAYSFTVTATDSAQTPVASPPLPTHVMISNPAPPVINATPAPPDGTHGTAYPTYRFTATAGFLPLSWTVTPGSLPPGLNLGSDGSLTGTPAMIGPYTFTVTVTDSAAPPEPNSLSFTIKVSDPGPPVINNTPPPTGTVGLVYAPFQFTASAGLAPLVWTPVAVPGLANLAVDLNGLLSGTPSAAGHVVITLNVKDALLRSAPGLPVTVRVSSARPAAAFTPTLGNMTTPRADHTATLLVGGNVLLAGGAVGAASAELYDPATGIFTATNGSMTEARQGHTATLLADSSLANYGKVLIVGPTDQTAELYDPATETFAATGPLTHARTRPTATYLTSGKVLVAGGNTVAGDLAAELYDPATGTFTGTGKMTIARNGHSATRLLNGLVLVAGGETATAELYDAASGTFTMTGSMSEVLSGHTATLLADSLAPDYGKVLLAGIDGTAELYDPSTGTFISVGNMTGSGIGQTASLRNDGTILVAGFSEVLAIHVPGYKGKGCRTFFKSVSLRDANLFAPESEGFTYTGAVRTARAAHTATVLADGTVLMTGGTRNYVQGSLPCSQGWVTETLSSAELFK
jgi:hypothetical protein